MSGGKGKKEYTVGYWYGLGMHMVLCHGPVDAVTEVQVGERTAWTGSVTGNTSLSISNRTLFGGEEREGGVDGTLDVMFGASSQTPNAYLQLKIGADIPAFRGVLSVAWRGLVSAMNPYIKPWRFRVKRIPRAWYPGKAEINGDANPAHIIRECITNGDWGMGYPDADIDDASFTAAADTLYSEGFGLSILWSQEQPIEEFLLSILRHIDGVLYVHPRTGRFTLKLARADYDAATLPVLSPANVLSVEEFTRPSWGEIVNQVTIQYRDGQTDKDASITVQDIAAVQLQGGIVSTTVQYPGISRADLANRVAMRELRQLSSTLAKVTLVANRQASGLDIGSVFKLTWPPYGITEMVMRVARISYGELADGRVRIEAVQDIFGLPNAVYTDPPPTGWQDPISLPAPCPAQTVYEVPYWQIVKDVVGEVPSILNDIDPSEGMVATLGARPTADAIDYHALAWDAAKSAWVDRGRGPFAPTALLAADLPQATATVTVSLLSASGLEYVEADDFAIIDDEWLLVTAVNVASGTVTLARGVLDTVPVAHTAGARVWFVTPHYISPEYVAGETAQLRLCPKTGKGELDVALATTISRTIQQRFIRPYPPGNVMLNGAAYPAVTMCDITVTWANRNRVSQTANVIRQNDGNITPETGQTTTLRIYGGATLGTLRRTYSGLTGTSQTWTLSQMAADGAVLDSRLRIEIESSRTDAKGTFASLYRHDIAFDRAGYGINWGKYWGGVSGASCAGLLTSYAYGDSFVEAGSSSTTWNPSDLAGPITLSNGNLTAEESSLSYSGVRATVGKSSGKWYWEIRLDLLPNAAEPMMGIKRLSASLQGLGGAAEMRGNGQLFGDSSVGVTAVGSGVSCAQGDVVMIALDLDNGKLWFGKNGTWSGSPGSGASPAFTISGANTWYPSYRSNNETPQTTRITARFSPSDWSYSPPTGFSAL